MASKNALCLENNFAPPRDKKMGKSLKIRINLSDGGFSDFCSSLAEESG